MLRANGISALSHLKLFRFPLHRNFAAMNNSSNSESEPANMRHFKQPSKEFWDNPIHHEVWSEAELQQVKVKHFERKEFSDSVAFYTVKFLRWSFDTFSGYRFGELTENKVLNRAIFLETVAGCPGMAGGMIRHLNSLRKMQRDYGWIHTLLEEAENERMHLLTFIKLKQPGKIFRAAVLVTQGIFMNCFFLAYLLNPKICHRFVGYLEEEAVHTYTSILNAIDEGKIESWKTKAAPDIAIDYWRLKKTATMRDLILAVRADEANHRDVNHTFASLDPNQTNPFIHK
jgi:hypothetical protein